MVNVTSALLILPNMYCADHYNDYMQFEVEHSEYS